MDPNEALKVLEAERDKAARNAKFCADKLDLMKKSLAQRSKKNAELKGYWKREVSQRTAKLNDAEVRLAALDECLRLAQRGAAKERAEP